MSKSWSNFINRTKNNKPRNLLINAFKYVNTYDYALDFGAGGLRDTRYLLRFPFKEIDVLDKAEDTKEIANTIRKNKSLSIHIKEFEEFEYINGRYNIINAQFALPFIKKDKQKEILKKLISSLSNNGIFVGNFFGEKDAWNDGNHSNISFYTTKEVKYILKDLDILFLNEKEYNKKDLVDGVVQKWHVIEFIAKK